METPSTLTPVEYLPVKMPATVTTTSSETSIDSGTETESHKSPSDSEWLDGNTDAVIPQSRQSLPEVTCATVNNSDASPQPLSTEVFVSKAASTKVSLQGSVPPPPPIPVPPSIPPPPPLPNNGPPGFQSSRWNDSSPNKTRLRRYLR